MTSIIMETLSREGQQIYVRPEQVQILCMMLKHIHGHGRVSDQEKMHYVLLVRHFVEMVCLKSEKRVMMVMMINWTDVFLHVSSKTVP